MKKFSERLGLIEAPRLLQTEGMSDALRNSLWNFIVSMFDAKDGEWLSAASWIAQFFRKVPVDELPYYNIRCREWIKTYFFSLHWYETYDFIEFIADSYKNILRYGSLNREQIHTVYNNLFERELSGYRFIAGVLAPISNPAETAEIRSAIELTSLVGLDGDMPISKARFSCWLRGQSLTTETPSKKQSVLLSLWLSNSHRATHKGWLVH